MHIRMGWVEPRRAAALTLTLALTGCGTDEAAPAGESGPTVPPTSRPEVCQPQMPAATQEGRVALPISVGVSGAPAALTTPVTGASGRQYAISFFRFYVSEPALIDAHGEAYPAALLGPDGSAQPYGVHLLALEDTSTHVLRLAATPGEFVGIELGIGLPALCHRLPPREQISPLDNASGMTWDWAGYLHLRFEGTVAGGLVQHHLFQEMAFTRVVVPGSIRVGSQAPTPMLVLDVDRLLEQGMPLTTPSAHGVEGWIMDNFERNAALVLR